MIPPTYKIFVSGRFVSTIKTNDPEETRDRVQGYYGPHETVELKLVSK